MEAVGECGLGWVGVGGLSLKVTSNERSPFKSNITTNPPRHVTFGTNSFQHSVLVVRFFQQQQFLPSRLK